MSATLSLVRYQLGGFDVALAGRRPQGRALVVYLDRLGQPTDRYREVDAVALRRIGTHLAEIKAAIAALPEVRFAWQPGTRAGDASPPDGKPVVIRHWRRLFAHHAIPAGDE